MNIALIGYGKMGKAIAEIALEKGHSVALRISAANKADLTASHLQKCDVAIEFTGPQSAAKNIEVCLQAGIPVISGSTGWLDKWEDIKALCLSKKGAFLYASNFSIGVNIFFELNKKLAALMAPHPGYDVSIKEIHHTQKKDAPSGTAITLAEQVLARINTKSRWTLNTGEPADLVITSERTDPAPGTHHVTYHSAIDDIEIIHTAHSRQGFAAGALLAAEFISSKKGIYTMKDVLGID
jgi:4-hydroxy-tetrahydrodipicolinate reductase